MQCIFINLDAQTLRRRFVEDNFDAWADPEWTLHRLPAIDTENIPPGIFSEHLRGAEKACYASHVAAIRMAAEWSGPTLIMEDDLWLGPCSAELINEACNRMRQDATDIIFTDVCIVHPQTMLELFLRRQQWRRGHSLSLIDLAQMPFAGATGYLLSDAAKSRLLEILLRDERIDQPFDLVLRNIVHRRELSASVIFPFATSLSVHAESSQIQRKESEMADASWNAFRRVVCADSGHRQLRDLWPNASFGDALGDPDVDALCRVLRVCLSPRFPVK